MISVTDCRRCYLRKQIQTHVPISLEKSDKHRNIHRIVRKQPLYRKILEDEYRFLFICIFYIRI